VRGESAKNRFEQLYRQWYDSVFYFVLRRIGSDDAQARAEDVTHETFVTVWRRFDAVPSDPDQAIAWIYGIARNHLMHDQRGNTRRQALAVRVSTGGAVAEVVGSSSPDDVAISQLTFRNCWQRLTAAEQEAISLAAFEDISATHAAAILDISLSAYKSRLNQGRTKLRRLLEGANYAIAK